MVEVLWSADTVLNHDCETSIKCSFTVGLSKLAIFWPNEKSHCKTTKVGWFVDLSTKLPTYLILTAVVKGKLETAEA